MNNLDKKCEHSFLKRINKNRMVGGKLLPFGQCLMSHCSLKVPITSKYKRIGMYCSRDNQIETYASISKKYNL